MFVHIDKSTFKLSCMYVAVAVESCHCFGSKLPQNLKINFMAKTYDKIFW